MRRASAAIGDRAASRSSPAPHRRRRPASRRRPVRRAGLLQDGRLPARLDPGRHPGDPGPRRGQQLHRHRHRGRRRVHHREPRPVRGGRLPQHHRRRAQRHPADGVRVVHRAAAAATSACTRPPTPSTTGRSTATWSARTSPRTRRSSRPTSGSRTGRTRRPRTCRRPGPAPTSGTTTAPTPAPPRACWPPSTSRRTPAAAMGADHPITWCKTYDGGRSFYTGGGHTQAVVRRAGLPRPPARRHPVRGRPDQGRLPAGDRLHRRSTTARPTGWSQAGPGSFTNADATLTSVGGMGLFWYSAKQFTVVLAEAGLADGRRRQLRRLRRLPAVDRPVVGGQQRLRDPDRRHRRGRPHHRRGLRRSSRPTSPPATPRSTRRGSGTPTSCSSRASGCGSSSTAC